jgi:hypothetical protein
MKKWLVAIACLTTLGSSIALDSTRNAPPSAVKRAQQPQQPAPTVAAPVGHRQPRAGDVPSETGSNDPSKIDAQDRELDRLIKGICKGC